MNWNTPVRYIPMVGPVYEKRLEKLEITTLKDLLLHIPVRYDDWSTKTPIGRLTTGLKTTISGKIIKADTIYTRSRTTIQKVTLADDSGFIEAIWFNQPFLTRSFNTGTMLALAGTVSAGRGGFELQSPEHELVRPGKPLLHLGRLVPIYAQTAGISSKWLRSRIAQLFGLPLLATDYLPDEIRIKHQLLLLQAALNTIHFPRDLAEVPEARRRLAFDELFELQLTTQLRRSLWQEKHLAHRLVIPTEKLKKFRAQLPFKLTAAQERVSQEILFDLTKPHPMNRMLQGEVGSGKTVVAAIAMFVAHENGLQSLLMAPTEILAEQHYKTLTKLFESYAIKVALITSSHQEKQVQSSIIVGTHALLEDKVDPEKVGLVVIDEQHRFGVRQRALLRQKGKSTHVLTMTATPIPRTTMLVFHGDLDLSVLDEMPVGRLPIKTWVVPPQKRASAYTWLQTQIKTPGQHSQAFIVCPFIEPSESMQSVKAAAQEFKVLQKEIFPQLKLGLLHGKMKSREKDTILTDFHSGKFDILVSTPVVEVGIDVSTATIMLIEAAERFGLAQLHQLRGRVGRGYQQSFCLLFTESSSPKTVTRLKHLETTTSGMKLAEFDLKERGAGNVFGTAQHGVELLKIASYSDSSLIQAAKSEAEALLIQDPGLLQHPVLKQRLSSSIIPEVAPD